MNRAERELLIRNLTEALALKHALLVFREWRFHPVRKWRFDLALAGLMIALEIEGGAWVQGRHVRGAGFLGDIEKYNEAQLLGWIVLRCTWAQVKNGEAEALMSRAIKARES